MVVVVLSMTSAEAAPAHRARAPAARRMGSFMAFSVLSPERAY
jgi:hypothetical protein